MKNQILEGDSLEVLKTLPDGSVDCVVTSPPYWGLRDYGTAKWEGGDESCSHENYRVAGSDLPGSLQSTNKASRVNPSSLCDKCGAHRVDGQIGLEKTPDEYVAKMVLLFHEIHRVLKDSGTLWLNLGDTYSAQRWTGGMVKNLVGIPWRVALALQSDGWILRQDIIWNKPNPMPESVTDRCTKSHEYIFLLVKNQKYFFDNEAIKEKAIYGGTEERIARQKEGYKTNPTPERNGIRIRDNRAGKGRIAYGGKRNGEEGTGQESFVSIPEMRNKRSVWSVTTKPFKDAHFATFPEDLIAPMIRAGCPMGGVVLDPFMGSGTTAVVAKKLGRNYLGIELNPKYIKMAEARIAPARSVML